MKIGKRNRQERIKNFVYELNKICFENEKSSILGDFIEILEGETYDTLTNKIGEMSTNQMCELAIWDFDFIMNQHVTINKEK